MFSPLRILYHFWIWPIPSYLKEPPCTLRTHSVDIIQHYTLWWNKNKYECLVGYNFRSTQGRPTNLHPNEGLRSPLFEYHIIFEFDTISSYLKEPPCTQSTPSSCRCSQWEQINTTLWRNKNKYECMVGYNFRIFQGRPTNLYPNESHVLPFKNIISFLNLANSFIP